jgi:hypothetical protein
LSFSHQNVFVAEQALELSIREVVLQKGRRNIISCWVSGVAEIVVATLNVVHEFSTANNEMKTLQLIEDEKTHEGDRPGTAAHPTSSGPAS